jgi:hypothetical protein
MTNISATVQANGTATVTFTIQGGTNGVFYDIFATTSLDDGLGDLQWTWIGQGMSCNSYTFTNQPAGQAFYVLEIPSYTMTVGFGDNNDGQINLPSDLDNAYSVAAGGYFSLVLRNNGTVIGWGDNAYGETNIPSGLTNVIAIAAGYYHGVALLANGSVTNWGHYYDGGTTNFCSVTNRTYASAPPTSGVVAIAAGDGQDLALLTNGTCVAWGYTNVNGTGAAYGTQVPSNLNLTNVAAVACGWSFNLALSSNGTITSWGLGNYLGQNLTNVPSDLTTNTAAFGAGGLNSVAVRKNGTVEAWGITNSGVPTVPSGLSNVVAVATGGQAALALQANGTLVAWGLSSLTNIPVGVEGVKAISAGFEHNLLIESGLFNPVIFVQPTNQYALATSNVTFYAQGEASGIPGVSFQWLFNSNAIAGATNANLTLNNVNVSDNGSYQIVVYTDAGSVTSAPATFTLVTAPAIASTSPATTSITNTTWVNFASALLIVNAGPSDPGYPLSYGWQLNGTNLGVESASDAITNMVPGVEGYYTVNVTNAAGTTNITWNIRLALPSLDFHGQQLT